MGTQILGLSRNWFLNILIVQQQIRCGILILTLSILLFSSSAGAIEPRKVLFISSYHPGFPTFYEQVDGIQSVFESRKIRLDIEFMDTKRFPNKTNWYHFENSLSYKLKNSTPYNAIIVADDNALLFAIEQQNRLFKDKPIVFMGVNNIHRAIEQNNSSRITGVIEAVSMKDTIDVMIKFRPKAKRIIALVDDTPSGQGDLKQFYQVASHYSSYEFSERSLAKLTWPDFLKSLENIDKESAILLLSAYKDKDNKTFLFEESLKRIKHSLQLPVFHLWKHGVGQGLIGGKVISHYAQGKIAADIVLTILTGTPVSQIDVTTLSPNKYIFDYNELKKNDIDESIIPENSIIINGPLSFYSQNKVLIGMVTIIISTFSLALLIFVINIYKRRKAENELRISEERLDFALAAANDGIWDWDLENNSVFFDTRYYTMAGYTPNDFQASFEAWKQRVHPEDLNITLEAIEDYLNGNSNLYDVDFRYQKKDGAYMWIKSRGKVVSWVNGNPSRFIGTHTDISQFKTTQMILLETEKDLKESETRFKALHNASFGGIAIHDKGIILECNDGLSELMGYSESELIGMDGRLLISEQSRKIVMDNILSGYEEPYEAFGLHKNGDEFPMRLEARNIPYKGRMVRSVEFRDLTEQKKADEEKEQLRTKLAQAQKIESIGRLAGGIAHDFNNMLSIILGNTEIVLEDIESSNPFVQNLSEIRNAAKRSSELTRQLLAFARKQTISPEVVDLNHAINGLLKMLTRLIGENIDLSWKPEKSLWPVKIDPSQIDQILANLCVNARDSINDVGNVTIETENVCFDEDYCNDHPGFKPGNYVQIGISDNGCGMDKSTSKNLFEPFFTTKELGKGTGLGLATVYGILKQNNGFINVYSEVDEGTTFKIYLPRYTEKLQSAFEKLEEKELLKGSETILLVEDEQSILTMTKKMLERQGYTVLGAATPGDAQEISNNSQLKIDLLMTDVVMPTMNGRELAEEISQSRPDIKYLFMSGYTANVIAHRGVLDEGINFINKPFSKHDLSIKLREILN